MPKILRQNIDNVDYSMAGCALYGTCATAASEFIKAVVLTDGDILSDGMSLAVAFTNGNTAGNAPKTTTIYSSDQVHYYSDSALTQPFTLAPSGCYTITYTGTGNAYTYKSFPVLSAGGVTAPICSMNGSYIGNTAWNAGDIGVFIYTAGRFLLISVNLDNTTGILPVVHGGTGASTGGGACTNLIGALTVASGDVTDNTDIITSNSGGYAEQSDKQFYKRKGIKFWNYIQGKISSVLKIVLNKHTIQGTTVATNTFADTNPKVVFNNIDGSQAVSLTFTDFDSVQAPASLTLNGNQGGEYFIAPNMRAIQKFKGVVEAGSYRSEATSSAKLKIKINSTANWMLCFTVVLYQSYRETKIMVSGYQYGNSYWYSPRAVVLGDSSVDGKIKVYFGYDSVNNLWVGFDQGDYTGIAIVDVVNGYRAVSDYSTLFTISSVSSLGGTTQTTIDATFPKRLPIDNTIVKGSSGLQFKQISGADGNPANDWYHHLIMNHANSGGYYVDFAFCFHSDDFRIRRQVNGSLTNWVQMIHSGNIGSQSVASANYTYGTALCTTAGATSAKVASMRGFVLQSGATFPITFTNANSVQGAITLAVNGTTAKPIYINGSASSNINYTLPAGTYICRYDGSYYYIDTGYAVTQARNASTLGGQAIDSISRCEAPSAVCRQYIIRGSHSILFFNYSILMFPASTTITVTFPVSFSDYTKYVIKEQYNSNVSYSVSTTGVTVTNSGTSASVVSIRLIIEGTVA